MKQQLADYMRRLCEARLTTSLGGNLSARDGDRIYLTPSALDKATLTAEDILTMDPDGNLLEGKWKPSIETGMHLGVYQARPDVGAVAHAHAFFATLFAVSGEEIQRGFTIETAMGLRRIGRVPYAPIGSAELARLVAEAVRTCDVVLMQNHGVMAVGKDLTEACYRMEVVEQAAKMTLLSRHMDLNPMPPEILNTL